MPHTIQFLFSAEAAKGRAARVQDYRKNAMTIPTHVVHVEVKSHEFIELDADNSEHAVRLIDAWIGQMGNMTARYHSILEDGTLDFPSRIYDFRDYSDEEH